MKCTLLKLASQRRQGYRRWERPGGHNVSYCVPRLGMWPGGKFPAGWHLRYTVEGGVRGINSTMHPRLARAIVRDILNGTDDTGGMRPL